VLRYPVSAAALRAAVLEALEQCEPRPGPTMVAADSEASADRRATLPLMVASGPVPGLAPHPEVPHLGDSSTEVSTAGAAAPMPGSAIGPAHRIVPVARELGLIGNDPSWLQVLKLAGTIAATRASVLIVGEPGTGKSLMARLIHALGHNPQSPFVTIAAAEMADEIGMPATSNMPTAGPIDSVRVAWSNELHQARGGSLYLDEVAGLPIELQHHLLGEFRCRDCEASPRQSAPHGKVRFLLSTCEDLPALIEQGQFREDLYHRVGAISLMLPPLRHRGTDIELLAEFFRARYVQEFCKSVTGFACDALDALQRHDWPGNVRELEAAIRRGVALCSGSRIGARHLTPILNRHRPVRPGNTPRPHPPMGVRSLKEALEEPEKRIIIQALQAFNWNRQETAKVLGINRATLYKKMNKYGLLIEKPMLAN
jgi:two-component system response regulator HydG